jgi:hypothetical protein
MEEEEKWKRRRNERGVEVEEEVGKYCIVSDEEQWRKGWGEFGVRKPRRIRSC